MSIRRFYLIAYDISDSGRQHQVHNILQGYATGSQKSLYECWLTETEWQDLRCRLPNLLQEGDRLHAVRLPETDQHAMLFGAAQPLCYETFIVS